MSKDSRFYLIHQDKDQANLLRQQFHKALEKEQFIEEITISTDSTIIIEELKNQGKSGKLQKVTISQLDNGTDKFTITRIWRINLEQEILGISSANLAKTSECALLILQEPNDNNKQKSYKMSIILIELKGILQLKATKNSRRKETLKNSFSDIENKFKNGINRLYMLLSLNNHFSKIQGYDKSSIYIEFNGVIIYNSSNINASDRQNQLLSIYERQNQKGLVTVSTILRDKDKIRIKFLPKRPQDSAEERTLPLRDLLN